MASETAVTFLGTGTSHGVPTVDCMMRNYRHCPKGVCQAAAHDPRHRRLRSSVLVETDGKTILIDAPPDFREQMLREEVRHLDAVLFTHKHADHIMGVPDLRSYSHGAQRGLAVYGSEETVAALERSFSYIFDPTTFVGGGIPRLTCTAVREPFRAAGIRFIPLPVEHGACTGCVGYRFNDIAYIPDVKVIPASTLAKMQGLKLLIIDALRTETPHSTHLILPEAVDIGRKIGAQRVLFTHMCHGIHYEKDKTYIDKTMDFAWDGLRVEVK
ncbi:MAG: MBL fold metallo-hydrolase [Fibrobacterota bacterium]